MRSASRIGPVSSSQSLNRQPPPLPYICLLAAASAASSISSHRTVHLIHTRDFACASILPASSNHFHHTLIFSSSIRGGNTFFIHQQSPPPAPYQSPPFPQAKGARQATQRLPVSSPPPTPPPPRDPRATPPTSNCRTTVVLRPPIYWTGLRSVVLSYPSTALSPPSPSPSPPRCTNKWCEPYYTPALLIIRATSLLKHPSSAHARPHVGVSLATTGGAPNPPQSPLPSNTARCFPPPPKS